MKEKRKVFISFFHEDIYWKQSLLRINDSNDIFIDSSVDTNDISDDLSDEQIRVKIRDEYIKESSITIVLASSNSLKRKHVDWEIGSSMIDTERNRRSGIIVLLIDDLINEKFCVPDENTKKEIEKIGNTQFFKIEKNECSKYFGYIKNKRLYVNIDKWLQDEESSIPIQILNFNHIWKNPNILLKAIDYAYEKRNNGTYDTSIPFQKYNYN